MLAPLCGLVNIYTCQMFVYLKVWAVRVKGVRQILVEREP